MRPLAMLALASLAVACGGKPDVNADVAADSVVPDPQVSDRSPPRTVVDPRIERLQDLLSKLERERERLREQQPWRMPRDIDPESLPPGWQPHRFNGQDYYVVPLEL
jgi:hypothetical protein